MPFVQDISGCLTPRVSGGLDVDSLEMQLSRTGPCLEELRGLYQTASLPLLRLPARRDDLSEISDLAAQLSVGTDDIVICGVGGSSLGAQTLGQLAGYGIPGPLQTKPRIHFLDNLDAATFEAALAGLDPARTKFLFVSKSGSTAETMMQAMNAVLWLREAGVSPADHCAAIAVAEDNPLRAMAVREGFPVLEHDPRVGGRFSVLSNVGLLPAVLFGLDPAAIREGAAEVLQPLLEGRPANEVKPALGASVTVGLEMGRGVRTNIVMGYADRLRLFSAWYAQLWGESLGKEGKGTVPFGALGPVDQHSQLQLWLGGPNDKFHTIIMTDCRGTGRRIDENIVGGDERLAYLAGKTMGDLIHAEQEATADTLIRNGRPTRIIRIDRLDESSLGALMMHFMLETIIAAHLMGVEPYEQPAVEEGKILARDYLSRL